MIFEADSGITRDEMAEKYHYSARQVARYLRVSKPAAGPERRADRGSGEAGD